MTGLLVALGAAVGAPLRFLAGHHLDGELPHGTLLVNALGSFLLGLFSGLALDGGAMALLGTGFCGAITTFSAFSVKATELGLRRGTTYVLLTVGLALAACAVGFALGHS